MCGKQVYNGWQVLSGPRACLDHALESDVIPYNGGHAMSRDILAVISHLPQLRGSVRSSAQRFAFWANPQGLCQKSYTFLAQDRHIHRATAMRHVTALVEAGILTKTVRRLRYNRCAINVYTFTAWVMALVHERAGSSRPYPEQPSREKKRSALGTPARPLTVEAMLEGCRQVLTRLGLASRSP